MTEMRQVRVYCTDKDGAEHEVPVVDGSVTIPAWAASPWAWRMVFVDEDGVEHRAKNVGGGGGRGRAPSVTYGAGGGGGGTAFAQGGIIIGGGGGRPPVGEGQA